MKKAIFLFLSLLALGTAWGQQNIQGRVVDPQGAGVSFATVTEAGTRNAVQADAAGNFTIRVPENAQLVVTATGFQSQTINAASASRITLTRVEGQLTEVVVTTAQGIRREKRSLGYSAPTINNAELTRGQTTSALNALQGK